AFDPCFCKMRESRPGRTRPEPSGAFATDLSPFGVRDMAGGVADWVTRVRPGWGSEAPGALRVVSRGRARGDSAIDCAPSAARPSFATEKSGRVGFRLARSVTAQAPAPKLPDALGALIRGSSLR